MHSNRATRLIERDELIADLRADVLDSAKYITSILTHLDSQPRQRAIAWPVRCYTPKCAHSCSSIEGRSGSLQNTYSEADAGVQALMRARHYVMQFSKDGPSKHLNIHDVGSLDPPVRIE